MSETLEVQKKKADDKLVLFLKGSITEDSRLELVDSDGEPTVIIDLAEVNRINSYGIRQWINNLKRLTEKSPRIVFTRCPPMMVEQFNMISNFGADGTVFSFYLPFYSEKLEKSSLILVEVSEKLKKQGFESIINEASSKLGPEDEYVFNDIEDEYFSFLQFQKDAALDADLASFIRATCA